MRAITHSPLLTISLLAHKDRLLRNVSRGNHILEIDLFLADREAISMKCNTSMKNISFKILRVQALIDQLEN